MYCVNCGTQLPDDANFCLKCGKPQKLRVQGQTKEPKWETCEIDCYVVKRTWAYSYLAFIAEAYGPNGKYRAGETSASIRNWPVGSRTETILLDGLVQKLLKDRWEYVGQFGDKWYQKRLRRLVE